MTCWRHTDFQCSSMQRCFKSTVLSGRQHSLSETALCELQLSERQVSWEWLELLAPWKRASSILN